MDCPRCGAHNETDIGSCLSCGASMSEDESRPTIAQKPAAAPARSGSPRLAQGAPPKQCPNCMTLNAATFKFCARCGTPLGATAAPMQTTPAPMPKSAKAAAAAKPAAPRQPATATKAPQARPAPPPPPKPVTG